MTIRLLIIDDQYFVRLGLKMFFQTDPEIEVTGEAENGEQGVRMTLETLPDAVLIALMMPVLNGIDAIRLIRQQLPGIAIVAISSSRDNHLLDEAILAGADSVIPKTVSPQILLDTVKLVVRARNNVDAESSP